MELHFQGFHISHQLPITGGILSPSSGSLHSLNLLHQISPLVSLVCISYTGFLLRRIKLNILYELYFLLVGWWRPTVAPGRWLKDTGKLEGSRYVWQKKRGKCEKKKRIKLFKKREGGGILE